MTMWDVVTLRPGKRPLHALVEAFGTAPDNAGPAEIDARLEKEAAFYGAGDAETLTRIVDRRLDAAPEKPDRLLIYVDQWEELYAMAPAPEEKERLKQHSGDVEKFIELMVASASGARSRVSVVLTVRADFYNPLIRNPLLSALLPRQQVNIPPMRREDLRSAIETPAKKAGLSFAPPELVDQILDNVGLEEGRLPLLQFALKETWQKREGGRLTAEAYTAVGGVARAIEKTAQDAYERLSLAQKDAARRLFLRLVTPGEGQADTRARSAIPDDPEQRDIVNLFSDPKTRLLVTALQAAGPAGGELRATVEVAHEALIQRWPTLRDWVRANRENMRARAAILRAKAEWEEHGQDDKFLLDPGVQLERGRALLDNPGDVAVDDIRDYVVRSIEKDQRRLDAEREADLADQKRIAAARKRTTQVALSGLVIALVVAAAAVSEYFEATKATDQARVNLREAQTRQSLFLAGEAREQRKLGDPVTAIMLALEALPDRAARIDYPYAPEAELQLGSSWRDLLPKRILLHHGGVWSAAFSLDGGRIVTASGDKTARLWDATTDAPIGGPLIGHEDVVLSAAFSPDGKRIVTASQDKTARLWDAATGKPIGKPIRGHEGVVLSAAFSPDGKRIVTASDDNTARIWDTATSEPIGEPLYHDGRVLSAAFSSNGKRIVTASDDGIARVWDAASGKEIVELKGHKNVVSSAAFSADGERIVTASWDGTARIWNAASGKPVGKPLDGHERTVTSAAFSGDGRRVVTTSWDKTALIWDATSGELVGQLVGHNDTVNSAAFSPDGGSIVTASADGTAQIWNTPPDMQTLVSRATDFVSGSRRCLMPSQRKTFFLSGEPPAWCTQLLGKWDYETPARK
jgi:Tol biopolymer transport system component